MTAPLTRAAPDPERLARAVLCRVAEPADPMVGELVAEAGPAAALAAIREGRVAGLDPRVLAGLRHRLTPAVDGAARVDAVRSGPPGRGRFVCPGDAEWPEGLADLGRRAPYGLWLRGPLDLAAVSRRAVAIVGARAATGYGTQVAADLAAGCAERGWTVVSGAAFGVDAAAHRGALAVGGLTVAVLACGVDVAYPRAHTALLDRVAAQGLVLSELPPGAAPLRHRFLVRNRLVAALTAGTVVVEAALRSGARSTATAAAELGRQVMAVPGPVTSPLSAGPHELVRAGLATLVTGPEEVLELVSPYGEQLLATRRGPERERDHLPALAARVLEAVPVHRAVAMERVARTAGLAPSDTVAELGRLLALGLVERTADGWRLAARPGGA